MTDRIFRGDAVPVAQETKVVPAFPEVNDVFELSINGKSIRYTAAEATVADVVAGLASAWNDSEIPEFAEVTASDEGNHVLLTADTAGVPFTVSASATSGSGAAGSVTVEETTKGDPGAHETQRIALVGSYTGGTFTLTWDFGSGAETTSAIDYNAIAEDVQTAIEGLASVSAGDVTVTGGPGPGTAWFVTWKGTYARTDVALPTIDGTNLIGNGDVTVKTTTPGTTKSDQIVQFTYEATGGTYQLAFGGETTGPINYNDGTTIIKSELQALPSIGAGNVRVYGGASTRPDRWSFYIVFTGNLAGISVGDISLYAANLTYSALNTPGAIYAGGQNSRDEHQLVSAEGATAGTFVLTFDGETTAPLAFDAEALTVRNALEALPNLSSGDVAVGQPAWPGQWIVRFQGARANTDVPEMTMETGNLTGATWAGVTTIHPGGADHNEVQEVEVYGAGGSFTLTFDGQTTGSIAYGATAATVETALEGLSNLTDVTVTGTGTGEDPYVVTFVDPGPGDVAEMTGDASSLTGGSGNATTVVTAAAAVDEQQTVTVDAAATGGDFTLSFRNAQTSAIAYDASAATVESALEALSTVDDVTVTGSAGGPYTVTFAGDLGMQDVELMEADGSGLTTGTATESVSVSELTRSEGPNHWDAPRNWTGNRIPDSGDQVIIDNLDVELLYGLRQRTTFTADASTDTLTMTDLADFRSDQIVRVKSTGTLPAGLSENTDYWIVSLDRDAQTLKLATSSGGAAVDITDAGTGTHTIVWQMGGLDSTSRYTGKLGLKQRNDDGDYWQYRPTHLECGVLDPGGGENKKAMIGQRNGAGTSRLRLDFGDDPVDVEVYQTGGGEEPGVAACLLRLDNTACVVTHHDGELGIASLAGQTATLKKLVMHGGTVEMDNVTITDIERNSGELMARNVSMSGTLIAR